jgi:hypothetical protein
MWSPNNVVRDAFGLFQGPTNELGASLVGGNVNTDLRIDDRGHFLFLSLGLIGDETCAPRGMPIFVNAWSNKSVPKGACRASAFLNKSPGCAF